MRIEWLRVGKIFASSKNINILGTCKPSSTWCRNQLKHLDEELPIVGNKLNRVEMFIYLNKSIGVNLATYLKRENDKIYKFNQDRGKKSNLTRPKITKLPDRLIWLNVFSINAAISRVLAFSFSEPVMPHKFTKSKNNKNGYEKDFTFIELLSVNAKLKKLAENDRFLGESPKNSAKKITSVLDKITLPISPYLHKVIPQSKGLIESTISQSGKVDIENTIDAFEKLLSTISAAANKNKKFREDMVTAIDADLGVLLPYSKINTFIAAAVSDVETAKFIKYHSYRSSIRQFALRYFGTENFYSVRKKRKKKINFINRF